MIRNMIKPVIKAPIESVIFVEGEKIPQFVATWNTEILSGASGSPTKTIVLPMTAGPLVDWGDGTIDNLNSHLYLVGDTYEIIIDNTNTDFRFNDSGDQHKIVNVSQCNGLNITSDSVFERAKFMTWSATDAPNITTTNFTQIFLGCEALNGGGSFGTWDVSAVTSMSNAFFGAFVFTGMDIEDWDVGNCLNFTQMFFAANAFAAPIGVWNMSSATNISGMFRSNNFFNQDIDAWDISNAQQMNHMFAGATSFTQDLNSWTPTSATTTHAMFSSLSYNGNITGWVFTSTISDMSWMFAGDNTFNQDISGWNVASAVNMGNMFGAASAFNQDLTGWDIGSVTNMDTMFNSAGLSQANYDLFLVMCDSQTVQPNVPLGAVGLTYTDAPAAGGVARASLIANDTWTITDGGPA